MKRAAWVPAAVVLSLAAPAAAQGATLTVDPAAADGCNGGTCKTIAAALAATADGDTVDIRKGRYTEPTLTVAKKGVTVKSDVPGQVGITSSSTTAGDPVFNLTGEGAVLRGLVIGVQAGGGEAVRVSAPGTTIEVSTLLRQGAPSADVPVLRVMEDAVNGGVTTIRQAFVVNAPAGGEQTAATIAGTVDSSLLVEDSVVAGGTNQGAALSLPGGAREGTDDAKPIANVVRRSQLFAGKVGANGIDAVTTGARAKRLVLDSTIVVPGADGAGLLVSTPTEMVVQQAAGRVDVAATHVTIAGGNRTLDLRGQNSAGPVTATFDRSILHARSAANIVNYTGGIVVPGLPPAQAPATKSGATIRFSDTTEAAKTGDAFVTLEGTTKTAGDQLFAGPAARDFHLRLDAPVLDKAGPLAPGESDRDVDGEPRVSGAGSDPGADEAVNKAPRVKALTADRAQVLQGQTVTFTADAADPEAAAGGGLVKYVWDFGDGQTAETTVPTVQHPYAAVGAAQAKVTVTDRQGAAATSAPLAITVRDGTAPAVSITSPAEGKAIARFKKVVKRTTLRRNGKVVRDAKGKARVKRTTTLKAKKLAFTGQATDDNGVAAVFIALRRLPDSGASCTFFDGKGSFVKKQCTSTARLISVAVKGSAWAFNLKTSSKVKAGSYQLEAIAVDRSGVASTIATRKLTLK